MKEYVYCGFGFPITLRNVKITQVNGEDVPHIDYAKLRKTVLELLARKPSRLIGKEVRFVRQCLEMPLTEFGEHFGVSHVAVKKWESKSDCVTEMSWSAEKDLRMFILRKLGKSPEAIISLYDLLKTKYPNTVPARPKITNRTLALS
ncbi:MAG: hypothetical protein HZB26_11560 [Candidatus Hydrogenedentes bacterium]|nr:hypothetical protein [Candidatus Hydrogenedentota bacterium]